MSLSVNCTVIIPIGMFCLHSVVFRIIKHNLLLLLSFTPAILLICIVKMLKNDHIDSYEPQFITYNYNLNIYVGT